MNTAGNIGETIDRVFEIIMLLLPIVAAVATWFLRTYVKSAKTEKNVAAIVRLSNAAIAFAEDLDKRGDLEKYLKLWNMPEDVLSLTSNGLKKLNLAGKWLETELGRQGIQMTDEEAKSWIAAQFQERVGDIGRDRGVAERTQEAVGLLRALQQSGLIFLPTDGTQAAIFGDVVANWVVGQLNPGEEGVLRKQAVAQFQSQLVAKPQVPAGGVASGSADQLTDLARQSVQYVQQLKANHQLTLPEADIAVAWVLTEVTKQGLVVTTDQIANAVRTAFSESGAG
jgi:hypothetical protein